MSFLIAGGGGEAALPAASPAPAAPAGWAPAPASEEGVGSGPRPRAAEAAGRVVITEVEQVAVLLDNGHYGREIQWVVIRNESDHTVNVAGWNLTSEEGIPFAANGLDLVRGYHDLVPGDYGLIVTSSYVELDRGITVEYRNVFTLINPNIDYNFALTDFQEIRLRNDRATLVDNNNPECVGGCCCNGNILQGCATTRYEETCENDCNNTNCSIGTCNCWVPGDCVLGMPTHCCQGVSCM